MVTMTEAIAEALIVLLEDGARGRFEWEQAATNLRSAACHSAPTEAALPVEIEALERTRTALLNAWGDAYLGLCGEVSLKTALENVISTARTTLPKGWHPDYAAAVFPSDDGPTADVVERVQEAMRYAARDDAEHVSTETEDGREDWANARGAGSRSPSAAIRGRGEPSSEITAEPLSPANPALVVTPPCDAGEHTLCGGCGCSCHDVEQDAPRKGPGVNKDSIEYRVGYLDGEEYARKNLHKLSTGSAERELLDQFASNVRATLACKACSAVLPHHNGLQFTLAVYDEEYPSNEQEAK